MSWLTLSLEATISVSGYQMQHTEKNAGILVEKRNVIFEI